MAIQSGRRCTATSRASRPLARCMLMAAVLLLSVVMTTSAGSPAGAASSPPTPSAWRVATLLTGTTRSVSCPSATDCYAAGSQGLLVSSDGGSIWTTYPPPPEFQALESVDCPTVGSCVVSGYNTYTVQVGATRYSYDVGGVDTVAVPPTGPTWTRGSVPVPVGDDAAQPFGAVSCPTTSVCFAYGESGLAAPLIAFYATVDGGLHWTAAVPPAAVHGIHGLACTGSTTCLATGNASDEVSRTTDAGATWSVSSVPVTVSQLAGIACPTATDCVATSATGVIGSTDGGVTWSTLLRTPPAHSLTAISCPTPTTCTAVGADGTVTGGIHAPPYIVSTADGGAHWAQGSVPAIAAYGTGVACGTASCVVSASGSTGGGTYLLTEAPPGPLTITAASLYPAIRGTPYFDVLTAVGGVLPYRWTAHGLPKGITMSSNGALNGEAFLTDRAGSVTVRVTVHDAARRPHAIGHASFTLSVS